MTGMSWQQRYDLDHPDQSEKLLRDLLAVIHRDGGQYTALHGLKKAADDAAAAFLSMRGSLELLEKEYERKVLYNEG